MKGRRRRTCVGCLGKGKGVSLRLDRPWGQAPLQVIRCPLCGGRGKTTPRRNREFCGVRRALEGYVRTALKRLERDPDPPLNAHVRVEL